MPQAAMKLPRSVAAMVFVPIVACSAQVSGTDSSATGAPRVSQAVPTPGVPDRGDDPAVVAIDVAGQALCGGALLAPDLVLTARRCVVSMPPQSGCQPAPEMATPRSADAIRILVGERQSAAEERARGSAVILPAASVPCAPDIAVVVLDTPIDGIQPMIARATGAARGDRLRTVAFTRRGGSTFFEKVVRDHLRVLDSTPSELLVGEACEAAAGGPAIDEVTGEIVGVASHPGDSHCGDSGAFDVYTRADAFQAFLGEALAKSSFAARSTRGQARTKKGPLDMGANCVRGADCAAGVCVAVGDQQYCSRTCDTRDRCPPRFRCRTSSHVNSVCTEG